MRVFVTGPGRCGTVTFAEACKAAITNYTALHESHAGMNPPWEFPDNHIEVDARLTWHVPKLIKKYPDAAWVVLDRNRDAVIWSWHKRGTTMTAWRRLSTYDAGNTLMGAQHYVEFVYELLDALIPRERLWLTTPVSEDEARTFWKLVGAQGDFARFATTLRQVHNPTR